MVHNMSFKNITVMFKMTELLTLKKNSPVMQKNFKKVQMLNKRT